MKSLQKTLSTLLSLAILFGSIIALWQRQAVYDWWRLRDYEPPARISELAQNTTMTDLGRKLFYVHYPELNDRVEFNNNCQGSEQTIVLGCYKTNTGIYLFDVTDPNLEGVEEVTAAHEMLHAAYDRLSKKERQRIDGLLRDQFQKIDNQRVKEVVASYNDRDPGSVPNELHSILATELSEVGAELESYYRQYFNNRQQVVKYSKGYEAVFTAKKQQAEELLKQIESLENQLANERTAIEDLNAQLNSDSARLQSLRDQNRIEEYNAGVPPYNQKVNQYRVLVENYNSDVRELNRLIEQYNNVALEQRQLMDAIDSRPPRM